MLPIIGVSIFYSFSTKEAVEVKEFSKSNYSTTNLELFYTVTEAPEISEDASAIRMYPQLGKSYVGFKEALAFTESGGNYHVINTYGYLGKYQFGSGTLDLIGIRDTIFFINAPHLQEAAFYANASRNKWILRRDIARFENKIINNVKITESGILAAAHLAGPGNVKKYLRSGGAITFNDGYGTSIQDYFRKFAGYDTSFVRPVRKAKALTKA